MVLKIILVLITSFFTAASQTLFKRTTLVNGIAPGDAGGYFSFFIKLLSMPSFLIALFLYGTAFLLWIFLLSRTSLSILYPISIALNIVLVLILSRFVLGEPLTPLYYVGVAVITFGIFLVLR